MNTNVGGDVVALDSDDAAPVPAACKGEIVHTLSTDVAVTQMVIERFSQVKSLATVEPFAY